MCNKDSYNIRIPKQEGLLVLVGLAWLCIGVLISQTPSAVKIALACELKTQS